MLSNCKIHHVAIICSDYQRSRRFYTETLGFKILQEVYRAERKSYKLDLQVGSHSQIELFSFPATPERLSGPEACGLRHLAFEVEDVAAVLAALRAAGVEAEDIRVDEYTNKRFTFFRDPDMLPLEIYERKALSP
ncbi:MAG: VOC family protein [Cyanobacteria bacterium REEB67]|nr:VOC family protein [Cyanobacteria bacterium REEB67]